MVVPFCNQRLRAWNREFRVGSTRPNDFASVSRDDKSKSRYEGFHARGRGPAALAQCGHSYPLLGGGAWGVLDANAEDVVLEGGGQGFLAELDVVGARRPLLDEAFVRFERA